MYVSWAVPKGLPDDPKRNHLAVHVEDHPLEYGSFEGTIPKGEYGAGTVTVWDRGTYEADKWTEREVKFHLHGHRVDARFVLFQTDGDNWMIHREGGRPPGWEPIPELVRPMLATLGDLPEDETGWRYEFKWDGVRAVAYVDGGRLRLLSRNDRDVTASYPELRPLGEALGSRRVVLDGEIIAVDGAGRPSFEALQSRMHVADAQRARRLASRAPVTYMVFDILYLDGRSTLDLPYHERRRLLAGLGLTADRWAVPESHPGPGAPLLEAARSHGLEGLVAKRVDSPYRPGRRSPEWVKIKIHRTQEVVIGGWTPGKGTRRQRIGALLVGVPGERGLSYVGKVGTGFSDAVLADLQSDLRPLSRSSSPFAGTVPKADALDATWVDPALVGEVRFGEWTKAGRLRHPAWRGLRPDKSPADVVRES